MDRKYGHRGYRDTEKGTKREKPDRKPPQGGPRADQFGPRTPRMVGTVTRGRCSNCGAVLTAGFDPNGQCPKCQFELHSCKQCRFFDSGAQFECTQPVPERGFLLHSYGGSVDLVPVLAKLGAYFSFNGAFLDPRKDRLQALYAALPADRLLVETDAPAMRLPATRERFAPLNVPDGSHANHPANLAATYAGLAELRGATVESLAATVAENFHRLFGRV